MAYPPDLHEAMHQIASVQAENPETAGLFDKRFPHSGYRGPWLFEGGGGSNV